MPIKVANIILEGRLGGPQNRILQVAEKLKTHEIETIAIIPEKGSDFFYSKLLEKNIQVKKLNLHRLTKHSPHLIGWLIFFISELFSLYSYLKHENIKLIHCNISWQIKGILAGKIAKAKVIWHLQDTRKHWIKKILINILARFLCDGIIVAGNRVRNCYLNSKILNKKKIMEIQAPVDTSYFKSNNFTGDEVIKDHSGIKIATVGNINPAKGIEYFIKMAKILNNKYKNLNFYIVGSILDSQKKYSSMLDQLVLKHNLNNIRFYGRSQNVPMILKSIDIYVCSSVREASPISVWEAMAMEKAIVSTDVGDVNVYIKDGENGFVVPIKNSYALAEKVDILIQSMNLRKKFGKRAREVATKYLDIEVCTRKHIEFYKRILQRG